LACFCTDLAMLDPAARSWKQKLLGCQKIVSRTADIAPVCLTLP